MQNKITNAALLVVGLIVGFGVAVVGQKDDIAKVIDSNTEIIQENGVVAKRMEGNSDIIMRYAHYLDNHDPKVKKVMFCPECLKESNEALSKILGEAHDDDVTEDVPETFDQLLKDCEEIRRSSKATGSSLYGQSIALKSNLEKIKNLTKGNSGGIIKP